MATDTKGLVLDKDSLSRGQASYHVLESGRVVTVIPMFKRGTGRMTKILVR
jgi:hypothetical protein